MMPLLRIRVRLDATRTHLCCRQIARHGVVNAPALPVDIVLPHLMSAVAPGLTSRSAESAQRQPEFVPRT